MEIPLRHKYRIGGKSRYKSPAGTGQKKRNKKKQKTPNQGPRRLMVVRPNGKRYMIDYDEYYR